MDETETVEPVYVVVGLDSDSEQPYLWRAAGPDDDDRPQTFVFPIDAALWARYEETLKAWQDAEAAILAATPFDEETGRLETCCDTWTGYVLPGHVSWKITLAASGNQEEWPLHDYDVTYGKSQEDARAIIDMLPEEFHVHMHGARLQKVLRSNLSIHRAEYRGYADRCRNCGWDRGEHANAGEPIARDLLPDDDDGGADEDDSS